MLFNEGVQRVFDCSDLDSRPDHVTTALMKLRRGRVGVVPDESMYLMICDAFSDAGVSRIRHIKAREHDPLTVLVGRPHTVDGVATRIPGWARDLMDAFWPGPLTLVLRQQPSLVWPLRASGIGVRMPLHPVTLAVVRELGPTASTAVNRLGLPPARDCDEAFDQFDRDVDVYLDAGPAPFEHRSTMVDATTDRPVLVRAGALSAERLAQVVPDLAAPPPEPET